MGFNHKKEVEFKKRLLESLNKVMELKDPIPDSLNLLRKMIERTKSQLDAETQSVKAEAATEQAVDQEEAPPSEFPVFADQFTLLMRGLDAAKKGKDANHNIVKTLDLLINLNDFKAYCYETPAAELFRLQHYKTLTNLCETKIPRDCVEFTNAQRALQTLKQKFVTEGYFEMSSLFQLIGQAREAALRETKAPRNFPFLGELTNLPLSCLMTVVTALEKKQAELKKMESKYEELWTHFQRKTGELLQLLKGPQQEGELNAGATSLPDLISQASEKLSANQTELTELKKKIEDEKKERERIEELERQAREDLIKKDQEEAIKRKVLEERNAQLGTLVQEKDKELAETKKRANVLEDLVAEMSEMVDESEDTEKKSQVQARVRDVVKKPAAVTRKKEGAPTDPAHRRKVHPLAGTVPADKLAFIDILIAFSRSIDLPLEDALRLEKQILRMYFSPPEQSAKGVLANDKRWQAYSAKTLNGRYTFLVNAFDGVKPALGSSADPEVVRKLIGRQEGVFKQLTVEQFDCFVGKRQLAQLAPMLNPNIVKVLKIMNSECAQLTGKKFQAAQKRILELCRFNSKDSIKNYLLTKCPYFKAYQKGEFKGGAREFMEPMYAKIKTYICSEAYEEVCGEENHAVEKAQFIEGLIGKSGLFSKCDTKEFKKYFGKILEAVAKAAEDASSSTVNASVLELK